MHTHTQTHREAYIDRVRQTQAYTAEDTNARERSSGVRRRRCGGDECGVAVVRRMR